MGLVDGHEAHFLIGMDRPRRKINIIKSAMLVRERRRDIIVTGEVDFVTEQAVCHAGW